MPDFAYYQGYLQAGLKETERYLLSERLFWPLNIAANPGEPSFPNLTLGGLQLYLKFAQPLALSTTQKTTLQKIKTEIEVMHTRWRVAWENKASWEFKSRLRQWGNFIKEVRVDPEDNFGYYRYEVRFRVMLDLLQPNITNIDAKYLAHLDSLDLLLRALFVPGEFIWEPELAAEFPDHEFWYLWGFLKEP